MATHDETGEAKGSGAARDERRSREEDQRKRRREKALPPDQQDRPVAGLALSGGGIRSATFCLGLIQALASNGLLRRFDYLSSISGGGYIAAAVGRLIQSVGINNAEALLASGNSQVLSWLRKNGRYLTPQGSRDIGIAIATLFRSTLSTHFELALMSLVLGVLIVLPHALQAQLQWFAGAIWSGWLSMWWPIAFGFWMSFAPGCILAFWPLRDPVLRAPKRRAERVVHIVLALIVLVLCTVGPTPISPVAPFQIGTFGIRQFVALAAAGAVVWQLFFLVHIASLTRRTSPDEIAFQVSDLRSLLTRALRTITLVTGLLLLLGLIDRASFELSSLDNALRVSGFSLSALLVFTGAAMMAVRSASEPLQKALASQPSMPLHQVANLAGLAVGTALLFAWVCVLQWLVLTDNWLLQSFSPLWSLALVALVVGAWVLCTYHHRDAVNASTLHGFYRARLVRSYLSLGNKARFADIESPTPGNIETSVHSVVEYVRGDDVALADYRPQDNGGPIHLVGLTLNQTVDDHGDLYNADRKGIAVIVNADGVEVGPVDAGPWPKDASASLGQWITVSGAAAAPGAGSSTSRGFALLLFLFGVRLGYWVRSLMPRSTIRQARARQCTTRASNRLYDTKSGLFASEALASFFGRLGDWWYLSDGGHFENTGVYALIKREVPFILLADCGADPNFEFENLENLIRKARIDFDAEIELYDGDDAQRRFDLPGAQLGVLSPDEVANNHTRRGVLLARIIYHVSDAKRRHAGTLVIVKPNLHDALDRDVLAYASRNATFPQQSTADQFFDEAQWESYRRLGYDFGHVLTDTWLARLPNWHEPAAALTSYARLRQPDGKKGETKAESRPFWRREGTSTTLRTTFSLSLITTLLGTVWSIYTAGSAALDDKAKRDARNHETLKEEATTQEGKFATFLEEHCDLKVLSGVTLCRSPQATAIAQRDDLTAMEGDELRSFAEAVRSEKFRDQMKRAPGWITEIRNACAATSTNGPMTSANLCDNVDERPTVDGAPPGYWGVARKSYDDLSNVLNVMWARLTQWWKGIVPPVDVDPGQFYRQVIEQRDEKSDTNSAARAPSSKKDEWISVQDSIRTASIDDSGSDATEGLPPELLKKIRLPEPPAPIDMSTRTPTSAASKILTVCLAGKEPMVLYVQVFDPVARQAAQSMRAALAQNGSVKVPPVEDVAETAQRLGRRVPQAWTVPTLIVHQKDDQADQLCAVAVANVLQQQFDLRPQIRNLPGSLKARGHVLELWLPPSRSGETDAP